MSHRTPEIFINPPVAPDLAATIAAAEDVTGGYHEVKAYLEAALPDPSLIHRDWNNDLTVHAPSGDGASGPLGNLGRCIARISIH